MCGQGDAFHNSLCSWSPTCRDRLPNCSPDKRSSPGSCTPIVRTIVLEWEANSYVWRPGWFEINVCAWIAKFKLSSNQIMPFRSHGSKTVLRSICSRVRFFINNTASATESTKENVIELSRLLHLLYHVQSSHEFTFYYELWEGRPIVQCLQAYPGINNQLIDINIPA
jgi:hypothetical protein